MRKDLAALPGGLAEASTVVENSRTFFTLIDRKIHPTKYYNTKRDVPLINNARCAFRAAFPEKTLPTELRYQHEPKNEDASSSETPQHPPRNNCYCPSLELPQEYTITDISLGKNKISNECRIIITSIQIYLTALNKKSKELSPFSEFGHHNDAVRSIFVLIARLLAELSKMNILENQTKKQAKNIAYFLDTLLKNREIEVALRGISVIRLTAPGEHTETLVIPTGLLSSIFKCLEKVEQTIEWFAAQASILEKVLILEESLNEDIYNKFIFATCILSAFPVDDDRLLICRTASDHDAPGLKKLHAMLANSLYFSNTRKNNMLQNSCVVYDTHSQNWVSRLPDELLDQRSGLYIPLAADHLQTFLKFYAMLEKLGQLRIGMNELVGLLRSGGDAAAVFYFKTPITLLFNTVKALLQDLATCQTELQSAANTHYQHLARCTTLTYQSKTWGKNFAQLEKHLRLEKVDAQDNPLLLITQIEDMLTRWTENPNKLMSDLKENHKNLFLILQNVNATISGVNDRYREIAREVNTIISSNTTLSSITQHAESAAETQDICCITPTINAVTIIKDHLVRYSEIHGYKFALDSINGEIQLPAGSSHRFALGNPRYNEERHKYRAQKIYTWLCIILDSTLTEQDKLTQLQSDIIRLVGSNTYNTHFNSGTAGTPIRLTIEITKQLITVRLGQLEALSHVPTMLGTAQAGTQLPGQLSQPNRLPTLENKNVITILTQLLKAIADNPTKEDLVVGWQILCHITHGFMKTKIGADATMRRHQVIANNAHMRIAYHAFHVKLSENLQRDISDPVQQLSERTVGLLPYNATLDALQKSESEFSKKANKTEKILRDFENKEWATDFVWHASHIFILRDFLKNAIGLCDHNEQTQFLKNISRLFLNSRKIESQEMITAIQAGLNDLLYNACKRYLKLRSTKEKNIIRGLLRLGANALHWMQSHPIDHSNMIVAQNELIYYIVAEQIDYVLANYQSRAKFLGHTVAALGSKLPKLMNRLRDFSIKLSECVETDNDFTWKAAQVILPDGDGLRSIRTQLLSAILQFVYMILNDALAPDQNPKEKTQALLTLEKKIEKLEHQYLNELQKKSRAYRIVYNVGYDAWIKLKYELDNVQSSRPRLGEIRLNESAIDKMLEDRKNMQEKVDTAQKQTKEVTIAVCIKRSSVFQSLETEIQKQFGTCSGNASIMARMAQSEALSGLYAAITQEIDGLTNSICEEASFDFASIQQDITEQLKSSTKYPSIAFLLTHRTPQLSASATASPAFFASAPQTDKERYEGCEDDEWTAKTPSVMGGR